MARKSRKNIEAQTSKHSEETNKTALYLRLSVADNGNTEANSIENQQKYIEENLCRFENINVVKIFTDNGFSGTNFNRDAWQELFSDIQSKKINCVIVKDFSRLGRNFIETSNMIEKVFPFLGVRFISINDNYDSFRDKYSSKLIEISFKNIMNECYARDISKKIISAKTARQSSGYITTSHIAYGYKLSEDRKSLVINEDTAPVVKKIFEWRLSGVPIGEIIKRLRFLAVPSVGQYLYLSGKGYEKYATSAWSTASIKHIFADKTYVGDLIQNKTRKRVFEENKQIKTSSDEWFVRENAHIPLISRADFKKVQELKSKPYIKSKHINPLVSKVKCGKCGYRMTRMYRDNGKTYWHCPSHQTQLKERCGIHILDKVLYDTISTTLRMYSDMTIEKLSAMDAIYKSEKMRNKLSLLDKELCDINNQSTAIGNKLLALYEDYKNNVVNKQDYECIRKDYTDRHSKLAENIETLTAKRNTLCDENRFRKKLNKIISNTFSKTNDEYICSLVKEIRVFSSDCIEIDFTFQDSFKELADFVNGWEDLI
jgi:DNA invertase Pin-like site-specific DNA recombinase